MANSHRQGDGRSCGATTIVQGQSFVKINGKLWAVNGDPNTHGDGNLISSNRWIKISGRGVIVVGDDASADDVGHGDPSASSGDSTVKVG